MTQNISRLRTNFQTKKNREREFRNLLKIKDNYEKIVISADELITGNFKGVKYLHILDFLSSDS